jgi:ClpP class serine protease
MMWLLTNDIGETLAKMRESGHIFSAADMDRVDAAESRNAPTTVGSTAVIPIEGVLTQKRDMFAALFGGGNTLYPDIAKAAIDADSDPLVDDIVFEFGTVPGGTIDGLFDAMAAIKNIRKPTVSRVRGMAASAGYALAVQADDVIAANDVTQFGSVGIVRSFRVDSNIVEVTSTDAPDKRPDVTTEEGLEAARRPLDAIHVKLVEAIATGRRTSAKNVNENYGRGAIVIASDAIEEGMIDSIGIAKTQTQTTANIGGEEVTAMMTLAEFKAQHPALYDEAVAVGVEKGIVQERDNVTAHAIYGRASGDMETALEAIEKGTPLTETVKAKYAVAGWNKRDIENRDNEQPPVIDGTAPSDSEGPDLGDQMVAAMQATSDDHVNLDEMFPEGGE